MMCMLAVLKDIDDSETPIGDGFNAYFFKKTSPKIGDEVTIAMLQFFRCNVIYKAINRTTVTLIPKIKHPYSIRDYRPILKFKKSYKLRLMKYYTSHFLEN